MGCLPATALELVLGVHGTAVDSDHGLTETNADLGEHLRVVEVGDSLNNSLGALSSVTALEDAGADKDSVAAHLHHESSVGRSSNTASGEVDNGQALELDGLLEELVLNTNLATESTQLGLRHGSSAGDLLVDGLHVTDSLDNITSTGFTLCADHGSTLGDTAQGLSEITAAADKGSLELVLLDVVDGVGGGKDLGLVDVVDANGLENLALNDVTNTGLGHNGDGDGVHDLLDHAGVRHAGDTAVLANVGRNALKCHNGAGTGLLSDTGLMSVVSGRSEGRKERIGHTCSALTTSMMTPPFSMRARPALTANEATPSVPLAPSCLPLVVGSVVAILRDVFVMGMDWKEDGLE